MGPVLSVDFQQFPGFLFSPFCLLQIGVELVGPSGKFYLSLHCLEDFKNPLKRRLSAIASQFGGSESFTFSLKILSSLLVLLL